MFLENERCSTNEDKFLELFLQQTEKYIIVRSGEGNFGEIEQFLWNLSAIRRSYFFSWRGGGGGGQKCGNAMSAVGGTWSEVKFIAVRPRTLVPEAIGLLSSIFFFFFFCLLLLRVFYRLSQAIFGALNVPLAVCETSKVLNNRCVVEMLIFAMFAFMHTGLLGNIYHKCLKLFGFSTRVSKPILFIRIECSSMLFIS